MRITYRILVSLVLFLSISFITMADQPPDPGGDPTGDPVGGAPIGSGLVISLILAAAYGSKKMIQFRNKK